MMTADGDDLAVLAGIGRALRPGGRLALSAFNAAVRRIPEVEECHMIAGGFDYLVKVRTRDIGAYRQVLSEQVSRLPHVAATSTYVSMESVRDPGVQTF